VKNGVMPLRLALAAAIAIAMLLAATQTASAKTVWLCQPGKAKNPCETSLSATKVAPDGASQGTERVRIAGKKAPVDCFYVYPTVSEQPTANANLKIDPQQRAIATFQASRFSQVCRVWAPMYRQVTLAALGDPSLASAKANNIAYKDVRAAWRDYLKHDNHGRGVVFLSHSQGTFMLRRLLAAEIDKKPALRKRMVSALLLGGNVTVAKGKDTGGDFKNIRACRSPSQLHCVVAYSTYNQTPPPDSIFGRVTGADAAKLEVLCTNPAALKKGGSGRIDTYVPKKPFPGILGLGVTQQIGALPQVPTPWIKFSGDYSAECVNEDGSNTLRVKALGGARELTPSPDATWGLHLSDVNLPLGNLTDLVLTQVAAALRTGSAG
jgi:hypothetical protein